MSFAVDFLQDKLQEQHIYVYIYIFIKHTSGTEDDVDLDIYNLIMDFSALAPERIRMAQVTSWDTVTSLMKCFWWTLHLLIKLLTSISSSSLISTSYCWQDAFSDLDQQVRCHPHFFQPSNHCRITRSTGRLPSRALPHVNPTYDISPGRMWQHHHLSHRAALQHALYICAYKTCIVCQWPALQACACDCKIVPAFDTVPISHVLTSRGCSWTGCSEPSRCQFLIISEFVFLIISNTFIWQVQNARGVNHNIQPCSLSNPVGSQHSCVRGKFGWSEIENDKADAAF